MRRITPFTLVMALAILAFSLAMASTQAGRSFSANLTGAAETAGGDTDGKGQATVTLNPDKGEVCYELTVSNIEAASAAHIHEGAAGKDGPPKVTLDAPASGSAKGCKPADAELIKQIGQNPANYYVNVHNKEFPKGALRGQLSGSK
jgi:Cu/Zn superoxide dismutase